MSLLHRIAPEPLPLWLSCEKPGAGEQGHLTAAKPVPPRMAAAARCAAARPHAGQPSSTLTSHTPPK